MPTLEVADIFRRHAEAYRHAHAGHLGRTERCIMGALEACRSSALRGHGQRWLPCRPGSFLPVVVVSRPCRGLFLGMLREAFAAAKLAFFRAVASLADGNVFTRCLD